MARRTYTTEQIIGILREVEVRLAQGEKAGGAPERAPTSYKATRWVGIMNSDREELTRSSIGKRRSSQRAAAPAATPRDVAERPPQVQPSDLAFPKRACDLVAQGFDQIRNHLAITGFDEDFHRHAGLKRDITKTRNLFSRHGNADRVGAGPRPLFRRDVRRDALEGTGDLRRRPLIER